MVILVEKSLRRNEMEYNGSLVLKTSPLKLGIKDCQYELVNGR